MFLHLKSSIYLGVKLSLLKVVAIVKILGFIAFLNMGKLKLHFVVFVS